MICTSLHLYLLSSQTCHVINSRSSLPTSALCAACRQLASDVAENLRERLWIELIPTAKIETRHPAEGSFGNEFQSIYNHCGVMAAWSRSTLKKNSIFCIFWGKTTPYGKIFKSLFRKDSSQHWSTCCVQMSWNLADGHGEIVHTVRNWIQYSARPRNLKQKKIRNYTENKDRYSSEGTVWLIVREVIPEGEGN